MKFFYHRCHIAAIRTAIVLVSSLMFFACADMTTKSTAPLATPEAPPFELAEGWNEFRPAGDTLCTDGSEYRFFVKPGIRSDLLFYLQGGGACWSREHCDPELEPAMTINTAGLDLSRYDGIFNFENPQNPFRNYTVVFVPYCSGDSHLGSSDTVYDAIDDGGAALTVYHRGFVNVESALEWTYEYLKSPARIFVTGSSAGSIPSPYYTDKLAGHYASAKIVQLGDGSGGYRRSAEGARPEDMWGTLDYLANQPGWENLDANAFNFEQIYIRASKNNPEIMFSSYDTAEDDVQKRFLDIIGDQDTSSLQTLIDKNQADIRNSVEKFRSYVMSGELHTVLLRPEFYTYSVNDQSVRDWVTALSNSAQVHDVHCGDCVMAEPEPETSAD